MLTGLLRKNISGARIAGFVLSNFIGLAIILGGLQFYLDSRGIWQADDSFMKSDLLVVNKKVSASGLWGDAPTGFSEAEISDMAGQPWVRDVGQFTATDYRVMASVSQGGRGLSTMLFFESLPDEFVDARNRDWVYNPGDNVVPIIISKDYLALYNFGFAGSAGLPRMSESLMSGIPLSLQLYSEDGLRRLSLSGRIVGFSNRLNTILVPQSFMDWSNARLGDSNAVKEPSRLAINVSSPGDVAIKEYLDNHNLEVAGDKSGSSASFMLKVVIGIVLTVGVVITLLSLFILLLSMSLLMEKNRDKIHSLLMLGYPLKDVGSPYRKIIILASVSAFILAIISVFALRVAYLSALRGLGAGDGNLWLVPTLGAVITMLLILVNITSVSRKVKAAF